MSAADAWARIEAVPRMPLGRLPTPLLRAERLASEIGVADLLVKMDAETGFALGGNKVRKLELELAPERLRGVTHLVTAGGPQSNHCRVTAAAAARLGLRCTLVINGPEPSTRRGNALLHALFGADFVHVAERADRTPAMHEVAAGIAGEGGRALVVPIGASTGLGCLGYARAARELAEQLDTLGPRPDRTIVFVPSSSCGTLAGLVLGVALLDRDDITLVGVSADATAPEILRDTLEIARAGAELVGWRGPLEHVGVTALDDQVGDGYAVPTAASQSATQVFARTEGLVLDPTYTAKAAAGLIDWVRTRGDVPGRRIVFLHTGGHPALLA